MGLWPFGRTKADVETTSRVVVLRARDAVALRAKVTVKFEEPQTQAIADQVLEICQDLMRTVVREAPVAAAVLGFDAALAAEVMGRLPAEPAAVRSVEIAGMHIVGDPGHLAQPVGAADSSPAWLHAAPSTTPSSSDRPAGGMDRLTPVQPFPAAKPFDRPTPVQPLPAVKAIGPERTTERSTPVHAVPAPRPSGSERTTPLESPGAAKGARDPFAATAQSPQPNTRPAPAPTPHVPIATAPANPQGAAATGAAPAGVAAPAAGGAPGNAARAGTPATQAIGDAQRVVLQGGAAGHAVTQSSVVMPPKIDAPAPPQAGAPIAAAQTAATQPAAVQTAAAQAAAPHAGAQPAAVQPAVAQAAPPHAGAQPAAVQAAAPPDGPSPIGAQGTPTANHGAAHAANAEAAPPKDGAAHAVPTTIPAPAPPPGAAPPHHPIAHAPTIPAIQAQAAPPPAAHAAPARAPAVEIARDPGPSPIGRPAGGLAGLPPGARPGRVPIAQPVVPRQDPPHAAAPNPERPRAERPGIERSHGEHGGIGRPPADRAAVERPLMDRAGVDRPLVDRAPPGNRPGAYSGVLPADSTPSPGAVRAREPFAANAGRADGAALHGRAASPRSPSAPPPYLTPPPGRAIGARRSASSGSMNAVSPEDGVTGRNSVLGGTPGAGLRPADEPSASSRNFGSLAPPSSVGRPSRTGDEPSASSRSFGFLGPQSSGPRSSRSSNRPPAAAVAARRRVVAARLPLPTGAGPYEVARGLTPLFRDTAGRILVAFLRTYDLTVIRRVPFDAVEGDILSSLTAPVDGAPGTYTASHAPEIHRWREAFGAVKLDLLQREANLAAAALAHEMFTAEAVPASMTAAVVEGLAGSAFGDPDMLMDLGRYLYPAHETTAAEALATMIEVAGEDMPPGLEVALDPLFASLREEVAAAAELAKEVMLTPG